MSSLNLLKATRIERTLMTLSFILIAPAFANILNKEIMILGICCILVYSSGGILNAKVDKDFNIKYVYPLFFILVLIALIFSLTNYIIFLTVLAWIFLSFVYNKYSRRILFGDSLILSIVHAGLPVFSAGLLVGLGLNSILKLSIFSFLCFFLISPIKNVNNIEKDREKGYETLMTLYKNGGKITNFFLQFYFIVFFLAYFIFDLGNKFLFVFLIVLLIKISIDYYMNNGKEVRAYYLYRLILILFGFAFVFDRALDLKIILVSSSFVFLYLIYLFFNLRGSEDGIL